VLDLPAAHREEARDCLAGCRSLQTRVDGIDRESETSRDRPVDQSSSPRFATFLSGYEGDSAAGASVCFLPKLAGTENVRLVAPGGSIDLGHIARGPVVLIEAVLADVETFSRA
jgi:hypothetical protein